jgi:hypothetical protein
MNVSHVLGAGVYTTKDYDLAPLQQLPVQMDSKGNIKVTGSNLAPALATYVYVTDGEHTQPTLDDKSRGGYIYVTDGTHTATVNANNALQVVLTPSPRPMTAPAVEATLDRSFVITLKYQLASKNTVYNMLYVTNPLGSGKDIYLRKLSTSNVTSANLFNLTMHINPTVTATGSVVAINNAKIGSSTTSVCHAYNGTTLTSSLGTDFASVSGSGEQNTLEFDYGVILTPNNSLLVTGSAFDNSQTVLVNLVFTEVPI